MLQDWSVVNADRLCPALKAVFEHGLKRSSLLGGPGHPWLFIEEVASVVCLTCESMCMLCQCDKKACRC